MREKRCYVASSKETEFVLENITSFIKNIKKEKRKDIWLVGGGKMINQFITSTHIQMHCYNNTNNFGRWHSTLFA